MSYPPYAPNAPPPPGINVDMYAPPSNPGYPGDPQPGYPANPGYPIPTGYPPVAEAGGPPMGYPPSGGYPPSSPYDGHIQMNPITTQPEHGAGYPTPGNDNWMPIPTGIPVCPPGLEYLTMIDQLLVHQKVELLEAFISFETQNKYTIKNSLGQKIYTAKEDTNCCVRNCCGPSRPFDMKIKDNVGNEVIHLIRELRCSSCFCPCCLQKLEVFSPPGNLVGSVVQEWSILKPQFRVEDASKQTVLKIKGPFCTFSICGDVQFQVTSTNGVEVGKITKQWSGLAREMFTDADHFGVNFPIDLDVKMKAVLLGALFLIDYMFFEKSGNEENDTPGML